MNNGWRLLLNTNDAAAYERVESQISDLDLALALLERAEHSGDRALIDRVSMLARKARLRVAAELVAVSPDKDQDARIARLLERLRKRLDPPPSTTTH